MHVHSIKCFFSANLLAIPVTSFALGLLLLLGSGHTQANIFYSDDRVSTTPAPGSALSGIGRLTNSKDGGRGTAFLVGRCHILTNFHVAFFNEANPSKDETSRFEIGDEAPILAHPVDFGAAPINGVFQNSEDWALLKLESCAGDLKDKNDQQKYGVLKLKKASVSSMTFQALPVISAGFPSDKSVSSLTVDQNCFIRDQDWRHDCATRSGNSGGPLLMKINGELSVIALTSSQRNDWNEVISEYRVGFSNGATPVSEFFDRVQAIIQDGEKNAPKP